MHRIWNKETINHIGKRVKVTGWVNTWRAHGKVLFIDLRDRTGLLQVVFLEQDAALYKLAQGLRPEWVVSIEGTVKERPQGMRNEKIITGKIELEADKLEILSEAKTLPFTIEGDGYEVNEEKRLKYRYLDLRRERMKDNLIWRQKVLHFMREFLIQEDFVEVETPIITKSTPEGARDFLIPARLHPGSFYALPQSPQQYKQLLMVGGLERYFQIARCFRDEDPRADRQAEFTQLDIEMSFVESQDILDLIERLYTSLIKKLFPHKKITQTPFPVMTYQEAMAKYQSDKPDLRKNPKDSDELAFCFIVNFPMFERVEEVKTTKVWRAMHHPFTLPQVSEVSEIKNNPDKILAHQYDLALNGYEIAGGSLRSYRPEILEAVFQVLGHSPEDIKRNFGHLLEAFSYGVPPHGGIASGIDRFLSVVLNEPNIREIIAFPKTGDGRDLMMQAPSEEVSAAQLAELNIKVVKKNETQKKDLH